MQFSPGTEIIRGRDFNPHPRTRIWPAASRDGTGTGYPESRSPLKIMNLYQVRNSHRAKFMSEPLDDKSMV